MTDNNTLLAAMAEVVQLVLVECKRATGETKGLRLAEVKLEALVKELKNLATKPDTSPLALDLWREREDYRLEEIRRNRESSPDEGRSSKGWPAQIKKEGDNEK